MSAHEIRPEMRDLNVIVAGQGGDGSLTVVTLLAQVLRQCGMSVYTERDVLSRIKGGITAATLRASTAEQFCIGGHIDLLVALDPEAVMKKAYRLNEQSIVIYDNSGGDLPAGVPHTGMRTYGIAFSRQAVRLFRQDIYKNSIAFAVAGRVLGFADDAMVQSFEKRFSRMGPQVLKYNLDALRLGFGLADEAGLTAGRGLYRVKAAERRPHMQITGNEAMALGFLVAGGRFFAGYPITPSSEVMETLTAWMPKFGGVVRQAEDELSAVNMAIGAALTGVRAMTATCGPGLSLMQEGIGQSGMAEIPLVIIDAQRGGPSTGLPTKPEQSDLNLLVYGGHGDFPRIVLAPGTPEECFYLTAEACNLAQRYQCPVFIASDQALSQNLATIDLLDLERVRVDQGKRLGAADLERMSVYKRYALCDDGVSPYTVPGTPGGLSLMTGNEHDEFGQVSADPGNRKRMMDKRQRKLQTMIKDLPRAHQFGDAGAEIGFIGIGMTYGLIHEAMELLADRGIRTRYFQPQTLWPMLRETVDFVSECTQVFVVEYNATAQLAGLLVANGADAGRLVHVLRYDGTPMRADELAAFVVQHAATQDREVQVA